MPNVDFCVREAELGLCGNFNQHSFAIAGINDSERVKIFRKKDAKGIEIILKNCSKTIKAYIINRFYHNNRISINDISLKHGSDNNKVGADLIHILPNKKSIDIEVKFGEKTDKNIGMAVFEKIFGSQAFSKALSKEKRNEWRELYCQELDEQKQLDRLFSILNLAIKEFNEYQENRNYTLTKEEQEFMEDEILNTSGTNNTKGNYYLKFILDGDNFSSFGCLTTGIGSWIIEPVNALSANVKRVNVYVKNYDTNIQIKYTLNWKNDYKYKNGLRASAKLGLKTPNWNVWVTAEIQKIS